MRKVLVSPSSSYDTFGEPLEPWYWSHTNWRVSWNRFLYLHFYCKCLRWRSHSCCSSFEPPHDKTNKMACAPSEDSDQPGHPPSLIRVFNKRTSKTLIRLGRCPGWSESLLGTQSFCCRGSLLSLSLFTSIWMMSVTFFHDTKHRSSTFWLFQDNQLSQLVRLCTVSPEPSMYAHIKYGSRQRVRPKIRHLAPLDGCACAFEEWVYGGQKVP